MSDSLTTNNTDNIDNTEPLAVSPDTDGSVTTKKAKKEFPPVRRNWFARFLLCCVSFFAVFGIVNFVFFKLGMEPFGSKSAAIDDAKIQYIDFFTYYVDVLHGTRSLAYDFSNMLGGSSVGLFSYYLASPFNLLLYFFGKEGVYKFFDIAVALKLGTAGATFCWYLQRRFANRIRPVFVLALSMGYGLMQYMVMQSSNIMWLDGAYMLPLILLGVYEVLHRKTIWRLVLAVTFCIFCNWYIAGVSCLFSGIWFLFEYFFRDDFMAGLKVKGTDSAVRKYSGAGRYASGTTIGITDFVVSFCRYCWGMGIGVAMSAILFLPTISALRQGKGQYENIEFSMEFTGDLLSAVRGYVIGTMSSYGYAALFCGGIAVFGSIALLFSGSCRIRQKIAYIILLGVCFLMLQWKPAMLVFSLMKRADSYWYRYSYLIAFVLLFGAGAYLSRAEEDRWSKVFVVLLSLAYAAGVLKLNGIHAGDITSQFSTLLKDHTALVATAGASLVLAILTLLLIAVKPKEGKGIVSLRGLVRLAAGILLLAVTAAELGANAWMFWKSHLDDSQELYMEYSKGMQSQLSQLNAVDDGYYRIAQDRTRWHQEDDLTAYFNDSLAQNYWSNAAYTSSPDNAQIDLMWKLGYRDEAGCMLIVRDPVVASDSFLGVKYYLQSTPIQGLEPVEGVEAFNGRAVYRNPYALPMAFTYDGAKLPTMRYDSTFAYQEALFSTLSGKETELYTPLSWTRVNKGNMAFFNVYVPAGKYLAYGNLLWTNTGKMSGLMSVNGRESFGYCRWQSPAAFLIRSRLEQEESTASQSLQAAAKAKAEAEAETEKAAAAAGGDSGDLAEAADAPVLSEVQQQRAELEAAAAAYDREVLASADTANKGDVRTVVFRSDEMAPFSDYQFYALNLDALKAAVDDIREGEVPRENLMIENGHVTCSVEGRPGQSVCLLVPYNKGWKTTRNGEIVNPEVVAGTMITVPLVDGRNEIELKYEVPYLREGMYISAAVFGVFLIDCLCRLIAGRKKRS